jgi:hypothetical protein
MTVAVFSIKERNVAHVKKQHVSFKEAGKVLFKNDQLMVLVITFILLNIGQNATNFHACIGNNIALLKEGYYVCVNISSRFDNCEIARDQSTECVNEIIVKKGQEIDPMEKMIQSQGICRCDIDGRKHCQVIGGLKFDYYINLIRRKIESGNIVPQNFHVSAFRETLNDYEIAEAYFNYKYDGTKADLCTKKFFIDNSLLAFEGDCFVNINILFVLLFLFL